MEASTARNRVTQKRRVRFAERHTRRRQVGGATIVSNAAFPNDVFTEDPSDNTLVGEFSIGLRTALQSDERFAFLTRMNWWTDVSSAASNYRSVIENQDQLFDIGLNVVRGYLGLSGEEGEALDNAIVEKLKSAKDGGASDVIVTLCVKVFLTLEKCIVLAEVRSCAGVSQPKFHALFSQASFTDIMEAHRYALSTILLNPATLKNMAISSLVEIFKSLKADTNTLALLHAADSSKKLLATTLLTDKFVSFMYENCRNQTNKTLKDNFYFWGCTFAEKAGYETFINEFLKSVANNRNHFTKLMAVKPTQPTILTDTGEEYAKLSYTATLDPVVETSLTVGRTEGGVRLTIPAARFGQMAGILFNKYLTLADDIPNKKDVLLRVPAFIDTIATLTPTDVGAFILPSSTRLAESHVTINSLPGMLPTTHWFAPLFTDIDLNFSHFMRRLDPPHIHFLFHFVELLLRT